MSSEKKFFVAILVVALFASVGCSRNKPAAPVPVATGYAAPVAQPVAPAPAVRHTSTYIK